MKKNDLRDALSGIKKDFIAESDDFKTVSADFRKDKNRKKSILVSAFCLAFVGIGVLGVSKSGLLKRDFQTAENVVDATIPTVSNTTVAKPETTAAIMTEASTVIDTPRSGAPCYYSKLVKNTKTPELDGYDDAAASLSGAGFDIDAFKESIVDDSIDMIEGEILDIWVNHYEYATASDKFEPGGRLYHKPTTVSYKIRVDKVFTGDFNVGDEVTVEDYYFMCDSIVSIKKGSSYVIPIGKGDGKFYEPDEIVEGDTCLESCYYTIYQFHPQIEKVDGGYIVPSDWETLITDECTEIIMDTEGEEIPYPGSLYYVPVDVFNDRMNLILQS